MEKLKIVAEIKMPKINVDKTWSKKSRQLFNNRMVSARQTGVEMAATELQKALYKALEGTTWSWPRETARQNGSIAGTKRDIYDTGTLYGSQKIVTSHQVTKSKLSISYTAPYASIVHYGGAVQPYGNKNAATVVIPGRPWVTAVLEGTHGQEKVDPGKIVSDYIIKSLGEFVI